LGPLFKGTQSVSELSVFM